MSLIIYIKYKIYQLIKQISGLSIESIGFSFLLTVTLVHLLSIILGLSKFGILTVLFSFAVIVYLIKVDYRKGSHMGWYRKKRSEEVKYGLEKSKA